MHKVNTIERRRSPRHTIKQQVDIILGSSDILAVESRNISSSGLQIICDSWVTDEIEPRGIQSHTISHIRFKICMSLQLEDGAGKLYANCRVVAVQRLSQDEYMLNLAFVDFENGSDSVLNDFLAQFQQTRTFLGVIGE